MSASDKRNDGTESTVNTIADESVTRRGAMVAGATAAATIATSGTALADEDQGEEVAVGSVLNWASAFAHESELRAQYEIDEVDLSEGWGDLDYEGDDGEPATLSADGWELVPRDPDHEEDDPIVNNPVEVRLDNLVSERLYAAPRDVVETDADDEEYDVSFLMADEWTDVEGAILTGPDEDDPLTISGEGEATFDHEDFEISSSELSRMFSIIVSVNTLEDGDSVTIEVDHNGSDPVQFEIDPDAVADEESTIATMEGAGQLHQYQIGDVADDVDTITGLTIETVGSPDVDVHGLDLEGSTEWEVGEREIIDEPEDDDDDPELDTETVRQWDGGPVDLTSLETVETFSNATFEDVSFSVRQRARDLPAGNRYVRTIESPVAFDYPWRSTSVFEHVVTSAFAVEVDVEELRVTGGLPDRRYEDAGYSVESDEFDEEESVEDMLDSLGLIDVSGDLEVDSDDPAVIGLSDVGESDVVTFVADVLLNDDELDDLEDAQLFAAAGRDDSGGWLSGPRAVILTVAGIVGAWLARGRSAVSG